MKLSEVEKKQRELNEFVKIVMRSNLIVEADADYWHGNPDKYDDFDEIQEKNRKKDKRKNSKIRSKGYNLVRFWGSEIRKSNFGKRLVEEIKKYE